MEIERKFLVKNIPNLDNYSFNELIQAYLSFVPEIRIRSIDTATFYLSKKSDGDLARDEIESAIDIYAFQILSKLTQGRVISKTRYYIPLNNSLTAELDIYHGIFEGLTTVETEFINKEAADQFEIPSWYGKEITYDKRYKNKNLARCNNEDLQILLNQIEKITRIRKS